MSGTVNPPLSRDVFISYASPDAAVAEVMVETLERHGITCWIAPRDVTPGSLYADEIVAAINDAKVVVLVLSQHSVASPHVGKEIERASSKRRRIIALHVGSSSLTRAFEYFLSESQWIDVRTGALDATAAKLVAAVRRHLDPSVAFESHAQFDPPGARPGRTPRRKWMAAGGVALLLLALAYFAIDKFWLSRPVAQEKPVAAAAPAAPVSAPAIPEKSVAVLPFVDMSEKKDQEYFSDGLSEELIDMLTKVSYLRVPARTSSFYFKGKQTTIAEIGRALGVTNVLEGSVRKSGNTIRVTAQLIRVNGGYHLWSETYDRKLTDVLKIQDEIAGAVISALKVSLQEGATPRPESTANAEAYTLYLQARFLWQHSTRRDDLRAIEYLKRATMIDPTFAPAWATLSDYSTTHFSNYTDAPYQAVRREALAAATRALDLAPDLPEAHIAQAAILLNFDWQYTEASNEVAHALHIDPGNVRALNLAAYLARIRGRPDQALELTRRAASLDPVSASSFERLAGVQVVLGRYAEAESNLRKALELSPTGDGVYYALAQLAILRGDAKAALGELEREPEEVYRLTGRAIAFDALGRKSEGDRALEELERKYADAAMYGLVMVYASRNSLDKAFYWLDRGYERRDDGLPLVPEDHFLRNLRSDPRYEVFLRRMNLLDSSATR